MKPHLWLIRLIGVMVPRRLRAGWRDEWEAELYYREQMIAEWDRLNRPARLDLLRRSLGAFRDALWLQSYRWEDEMIQDLRFGVRLLLKNPGFTFIAVLTLALGIGANTAIFSVVNAVLLRPLPYPKAERMVMIWGNFLKINITQLPAKEAEYVDYRDQTQSFDEVAAFNTADLNLTGTGDPERIAGARVTANLFTLLEAQAAQGRVIAEDENRPGRDNVVVISHAFWRERMGGAADVIGRKLRLNDLSYTIIGVMPSEFQFPHASFGFAEPAEIWLPMALDPEQVAERSGVYAVNVLARLKPRVSLSQSQAELSALGQKFERDYRGYRGPNNADGGWRITVVPLQEQITGASRLALWILFGTVALVLLIACANVANLLMMRAIIRQKELAIRAALGARRGRIVRQLLIESMLLAGLGSALGLLLAWVGVRTLALLGPANLPRASEVNVDERVLAFTLVLAVLTGLVFGLAPAWQASKPDLQQTLKESTAGRARARHRLRGLLVVGEVALALPLVIGAGLLLNSFVRVKRVNPGVDADKTLIAEINLPATKYNKPAQEAAFFQELVRRVEALPGVERAGCGTLPILSGAAINDVFSIEGHPLELDNPNIAGWQRITPGYFRALGIPMIAGRDFTEGDTREAAPVAIINETLARHYFPGGDALGKRITPGLPRPDNPYSTIIGIVKDIPHRTVESQAEPDYYLPFAREPRRDAYLFARSDLAPTSLAASVRSEVLAIDRDQPVTSFKTMNEVIANTTGARRFNTLLLSCFALIALLLAALGIYSVNSYAVTQRRHEIGIRMALGAQSSDVLALVVKQGALLALTGVGVGLLAALALTRLMKSLLFDLSVTDPATFIAVALLLTAVALVACSIPARRATKVDPLTAIRHD